MSSFRWRSFQACSAWLAACSVMLAFAFTFAFPSSARAFEDKVALGAGAGYAVWPGLPAAHGAAVDVHVGVGLSEAWQLRGGGSYALHPHARDELSLSTLGFRAELVYLVDIVEVVPFGGLGVSGIGVLTESDTELKPAAHLVAGAAYWLSFDWLLQLDVRAHVVPDVIEDSPVYLLSTLSLVLTLDR